MKLWYRHERIEDRELLYPDVELPIELMELVDSPNVLLDGPVYVNKLMIEPSTYIKSNFK